MGEQTSDGRSEEQGANVGSVVNERIVNEHAQGGLRQKAAAETERAGAGAGAVTAGEDDESLMEVLAELPTPDRDSPESLIGSTAATKDVIPSDPGSVHDTFSTLPDATAAASARDVGLPMGGDDAEPVHGPGATSGPGTSGPSGSDNVPNRSTSSLTPPFTSPSTPASTPASDVPVSPVWVSLDDLDELTIVARAQDGDPQAFDWLISAYQGGVYRLCFRMLNDRSDAEDVVQETFIAAWRSLPKLTVPQAFIPWLYRTATNKCLDDLRRRKRRPADPTSDPDLETYAASSGAGRGSAQASEDRTMLSAWQPADPAQDVENQAQMRALADLLQTVPAGPRACWLLREVHEFSYAEIAAIVQLPESTVRGRIARAKRFLAEGMEPWR